MSGIEGARSRIAAMIPCRQVTVFLRPRPSIYIESSGTSSNPGDFGELIDLYYSNEIETDSTRVGGTQDIKYGYGYCGLPLVLEHNTPNDSLPIIWAETPGSNGQHAMRPLFRRRQRHSS